MFFWRHKAYEELPALSVRRGELRRSLRLVTTAWMFGIVWMTCIGGSRMNYLGRMVGFSDFHFGLLQALPFLATFLQLFATILIERSGLRKYQFITCASIHRILWIVVALIPLVLPLPSRTAIWAMLCLIMISWAIEALARPAWMSWMGDLIPKRVRGRYFATRGMLTRLIQIPVVIFLAFYASFAIDASKPITAESQPLLLYSISAIFAVAGLCGLIDILLFFRIREVVRTRRDGIRSPAVQIHVHPKYRRFGMYPFAYFAAMMREFVAEPLGDHSFRRYVLYGMTITFSMAVAAQFFYRHLLEGVGLGPVGTDLLFMVIGPIVGIVAARVWGRLIDSWGRRPVLIVATGFTVFSVTPYFFASSQTPSPQWLIGLGNACLGVFGGLFGQDWSNLLTGYPLGAWLIMTISVVLGGCGWTGVMLAQNAIILGFADGRGRSRYVAASSLLISIGGMAGWVGGLLAELLSHYRYDQNPIHVGPLLWNNWHAVFLLSFLGRASALLLLRKLPDPGSGSAVAMVRSMGANVYHGVFSRLFYPLRITGWRKSRPRRTEPVAADDTSQDDDDKLNRRRRGAA
jgi:MFS family permease